VPDDYTTLVVGERFLGRVPANPPLCRDGHGVCQFFKLIATSDGILVVQLAFDGRHPLTSSMDVSVIAPDLEYWGDFFPNGIEVRTPAARAAEYFITVWYGRPGAEFVLSPTIIPG
jgi:hypothetical protein